MAFVKRDIKDRVVQFPRRYQLVEVSSGTYDLIPVPGTVIEAGTPINKELLQRYEDGLHELNENYFGDYTIEVITSSTMWTVPANVYTVDVFIVSGGQGGTGGQGAKYRRNYDDGAAYGGQGGAGGKYCTLLKYAVTPGVSIPIVIGAGGVGGAGGVYTASSRGGSNGEAGSFGGQSSFDGITPYRSNSTGSGGNGTGTNKDGTLNSLELFGEGQSTKNIINGILYGGGGGGGGHTSQSSPYVMNPGAGAGSGGNGGTAVATNAANTSITGGNGDNGSFGGGGGGGGGALNYGTYTSGTMTGGKGGNGGDGVVVIRYKEGF